MLFCSIASEEGDALDTLIVTVHGLRRIGIDARIPTGLLPEELSEAKRYALMPLVTDARPAPEDAFAIFGAQALSGQGLSKLSRLRIPGGVDCHAFGQFPTEQADIQTRARLSYVFGDDPVLHELDPPFGEGDAPLFPTIGAYNGLAPGGTPRLLIDAPNLDEEAVQRAVIGLSVQRNLDIVVVTRGHGKTEFRRRFGAGLPVYHYSEVLPQSLAQGADILSLHRIQKSHRFAQLVAEFGATGRPILDCSPKQSLSRESDLFLPAPLDLSLLPDFLRNQVLPNLTTISTLTREAFPETFDPGAVFREHRIEDVAPSPSAAGSGNKRIVFMPTNGVGLGHAQRCAQIARELDGTVYEAQFAAYPSCIRMIKDSGFDAMPLIARDSERSNTYENDLVNYGRLLALIGDADCFIFDGGYVHASVYNTLLTRNLKSIWVRRGLWLATQNNNVALDREKIFDRVIVPSEAFDELNETYSTGDKVRKVGPIVDRVDLSSEARGTLRRGLAQKFGREFEQLVVTMLGAGVAADRRAQIQAVAAELDGRDDVLHLIVVWPTAVADPAWFTWRNTRVVKTHRASALTAACDLFISAVGYNSFHEVLYNRVPTLFMGQMNTYMDDQIRRAQAAVDRGLSELIDESDLRQLGMKIGALLDGGNNELRDRLAEVELPKAGNAAAARVIEELCDE